MAAAGNEASVSAGSGGGDSNVAATGLQGDHEFGLVMQVFGHRWIGDDMAAAVIGRDRGIGRFGEEYRRRVLRVAAHFTDMIGVILADTEYPAYRKGIGGAIDGQGGDRWRGNDE